MKVALVQLTSTPDPQANLLACEAYVIEAVECGAKFILTPEVSNCIAASKTTLSDVLHFEQNDPFLARMRTLAETHEVSILIGSLGVKSEAVEGKFANRSFLIDQMGKVVAKYDKIHMFDVDISETESYRESATYERGTKAVLAKTDFGIVGLSVCYDVRFPHLYRTLAQAGAEILTVPAAFAQTTGQAHWHALLRARAIENGAYIWPPRRQACTIRKTGKRGAPMGTLSLCPLGAKCLSMRALRQVLLILTSISPKYPERVRAWHP